ncbi:hypothetical protein SAMN05443667_11562 [Flavobacterium gillisiae]|uniref:Uncharacterized protein n=1 Tax=Flavobacterium gillisiae TaxID=150146 RepID=A0A1H4FW59_9FLAO|nr:hypothetical protein [Flavobacterium gillisiae]SEB01556.1 hypothetical protein SAMN05443667_11562 [Flavobacterium gillisiae]
MIIFLLYITLGLVLNFWGSLANYLKKEDASLLELNKGESWFYKYSLIFCVRLVSVIFFPIFYFNLYIRKVKPEAPVSFQDKIDLGLVKRLRSIGKFNNTAPTEKTTDKKIVEIYQLICTSFRDLAKNKKEHIPANSLNTIALKFMKLYEDMGEDFMKEHLEYELEKYNTEGLREEYKGGISLF